MLPYARLTPGADFEADRALLYYLQRVVTLPRARRAVASLIATCLQARHGDGAAWPPARGHSRVMEELRADGLAMLQPLLSDSEIARALAYFEGQPVIGSDGRERDLDPGDRGLRAYSLHTVLRCPGVLKLVNAPGVLRIAADYLGCMPTLSSIGVRWSFPCDDPVRSQLFHRDVDDWRFLKLFVYLTDVDEEAGPHCFVRTSHRSAFGLTAKAYTPEELERRYGAERMARVTGPRGTCFMADTLGIHRGSPPTTRPRLILQAQYSLLPVYAFRYAPIEGGASPAAAYCNRLLLREAGSGASPAAIGLSGEPGRI